MKFILLALFGVSILFASSPQEVEAKVQNVVDMQVSHTTRIEKRILKIEKELEKKAQQRIEKAKVREAKIKKLDKELNEKAKHREKFHNLENHSTSKEIKKELAKTNS